MTKWTNDKHTIDINKVHSRTRKAPLEENHLTLYLHFIKTVIAGIFLDQQELNFLLTKQNTLIQSLKLQLDSTQSPIYNAVHYI